MIRPSPTQARVLRLLADGYTFVSTMHDPRERKRGGISIRVPDDVGYAAASKRVRRELNNTRMEVPIATIRAMIEKRMLEVRSEQGHYGNIDADPYDVYHVEPAERWLTWVRERAKPHHFESPKRTKPAFNEQQMLDLVKDRYSDSRRYAFFRQFTLGTGAYANRRIDAFIMSLWPSDDFERIAIEVKVTRSDFLKELKDERKRERAAKFANRFYFAAPADLIDPAELPENVGLLEARTRPDGSDYLRLKVRAKNTPTPDLPMWLIASIIRRVDRVEFDDVLQRRAQTLVNAYFPIKDMIAKNAPAEDFKRVVTYWFDRSARLGHPGLDDETVAAYIERYNFVHAETPKDDS